MAADTPPARGLERISPVDTNDDGVQDYTAQFFRAVNDDTVIWGGAVAPSPSGTGSQSGLSALGISRRTATGWTTSPLLPPDAPSGAGYQPEGVDPTGDTVVLSRKNAQFTPGPSVKVSNQLLHRAADGTFALINDVGDPLNSPPGESESIFYGGMSSDARTVVYSSTKAPSVAASNPGVPGPQRFQAYRWRADGTQQPLGVAADGTPLSPCGVILPGEVTDFNTGTSGVGFNTNAVSADGATAFMQSPSPTQTGGGGACAGESSQVWVSGSDGATEISSPRTWATARSATFFGATPDARRAYFATTTAIAPEDPDNRSNDLYRWDAGTDGAPATRTCVSCGRGGPLVGSPVVSPTGSHVYFALRVDGFSNDLWVSDGSQTQIAVRSSATVAAPVVYSATKFSTSYDGSTFVFKNSRNVPTDPMDSARGGALYRGRVQAAGVDLSCVTCVGPGQGAFSGDPRPGNMSFSGGFSAISPPGAVDRNITNVSDDGETVVFSSTSPFTGPDTADFDPVANAGVYLADHGVISTVSPISTSSRSGKSATPFGTTRSGDSAFVLSSQRLTADAIDDSAAFYVARRGGGFAPPSPAPIPCAGEACRPAPVGGAPSPGPGSTAPAAVGNATPVAAKPTPRIVVSTPSASTRRALAAGRTASIRVRAATAGIVRLRATARISKRTRTVGSASRKVKAGTSSVRLKLNAAGRRELRRSGRLRVTVTTTQTGAPQRRVAFTLVRKAR
jgi:hypothetical protein